MHFLTCLKGKLNRFVENQRVTNPLSHNVHFSNGSLGIQRVKKKLGQRNDCLPVGQANITIQFLQQFGQCKPSVGQLSPILQMSGGGSAAVWDTLANIAFLHVQSPL